MYDIRERSSGVELGGAGELADKPDVKVELRLGEQLAQALIDGDGQFRQTGLDTDLHEQRQSAFSTRAKGTNSLGIRLA